MYNVQMRYDSDIALVELDRDVTMTGNVYPVCLPDMIKDFEVSGKVNSCDCFELYTTVYVIDGWISIYLFTINNGWETPTIVTKILISFPKTIQFIKDYEIPGEVKTNLKIVFDAS